MQSVKKILVAGFLWMMAPSYGPEYGEACCPLDYVNRQSSASMPKALWVANFTYVSKWQGAHMLRKGKLKEMPRVRTTKTLVRKIMQCSGQRGAAGFLLLASQATTAVSALVILCAATGCGAMCWSGFASNHFDIAPKHADVLYSISNTFGTIPGIIGVAATGMLLDLTGGYTATFILAAGVNVVGALVWLI